MQTLFSLLGHSLTGQYSRIGEIFASIPEAEIWTKAQFEKMPHLVENYDDRDSFIGKLASIRRRWSLDLLASILEDPTPVTTQMTEDEKLTWIATKNSLYSPPNQLLAAQTIGYMRLGKMPMKENPVRFNVTHIEKIKEWLRANKDQPDDYFFDGTVDYSKPVKWEPPPGYIPTVVPEAVKKEEERRKREANQKNNPPEPQAKQEIQDVLPTPEKPNWLPFILMGIFVGVALALVFLKKRRQG